MITQIVVRVDARPVAEANVVLDEAAVASVGEAPVGSVLVVGPAAEQVDPGVERLLEEGALTLIFDPPAVDRSVLQVDGVGVVGVVADVDLEQSATGVSRDARAVDRQVVHGVAPASHGSRRGSRPVVHAGHEPLAELGADLPVLDGLAVLDVGVLHRVAGVVVLQASHEVVLVESDAGPAPVELVVAVLALVEGTGVAGEGVDLQAVGLGSVARAAVAEDESSGKSQDKVEEVLFHGFPPV